MTETWSLERVRSFIAGRVQEDLHLDYKAAGALSKDEKKKTELSKDISAFANADGGTIIYGVGEDPVDDSLPGTIDPVDARAFSAEWLEQIATSRIQPKIPGLVVHVLEVTPGQVVYVVEIPKGETAHQAHNKLYYKRLGRTSEAMWDYEVRDVMGRKTTPKVRIEISLVRQAREIKDTWPIPQYTGDAFNRKRVQPEKKYETLEWLRVRAINEGGLVIQYLNVFVDINPPAQEPTGVRGKSEPVSDIYCDNTVRDVLDVKFTPGLDGGTASPKYGPSRYDPILPGLSLRLKEAHLVAGSLHPDATIKWNAHADNANPVSGELVVSSLTVVEE